MLSIEFRNFGVSIFFYKDVFKKYVKIVFFLVWLSKSSFGVAISNAVTCSFIIFCNSVPVDRIVVAALRLLGVTTTYIMLLFFAARLRKLY